MNPCLWEVLLDQCERHDVRFGWVKGQAGNVENERCDLLAREEVGGPDLPVDQGYESGAYMLAKASGWWATDVPLQ